MVHVAHGDVVAWNQDIRLGLQDCVNEGLQCANTVISIAVLERMG